MRRFLKDKKGSLMTAIIIFPLWLFILIVMSVEVTNHQTMKMISAHNYNISRIIQTSDSYNLASEGVKNYLTYNVKQAGRYMVYTDKSYIKVNDILNSENSYNSSTTNGTINDATLKTYWKQKNIIKYEITIYTSSFLNKNFQITFMGKTYTLLDNSYTLHDEVVLTGGSK